MQRLHRIITGLLLGMLVVGGIFLLRGGAPSPGSSFRFEATPPDFTLRAHTGESVSLADFRGKAVVLFFGFTNCPDVCPATVSSLARAMDRLEEDGSRLQLLFVTVDPERDTPERLEEWLANFHPSFLGLTGEMAELTAVAESFGAFFAHREGEVGSAVDSHREHGIADAGGESPEDAPHPDRGGESAPSLLVDHSARSYVLAPDGRLVMTLQPFLDGESMAEELRELLETVR